MYTIEIEYKLQRKTNIDGSTRAKTASAVVNTRRKALRFIAKELGIPQTWMSKFVNARKSSDFWTALPASKVRINYR